MRSPRTWRSSWALTSSIALLSLLFCNTPLLAQAPSERDAPPRTLPGFEPQPDANPLPGFGDEALATPLPNVDWDAVRIQQARHDLNDEATLAMIRSRHGLSFHTSSPQILFHGRFTRRDPRAHQLLVIDPERDELRLYEGGAIIARHRHVGLVSPEEAALLGAPRQALVAQLVHDGTMQLLLWRRVQDEAHNKTRYHMTLYKVIGDHFGAPFDHEVAQRTGNQSDAPPVPTAAVELFRGEHHLVIGLTPVSPSGELDARHRQLMRWDRWEGVFTPPREAPTAPPAQKTDSRS